jgi:hypothetical protein
LSVVTPDQAFAALHDAGIIPNLDQARRVVIDIGVNQFPIVHVEYIGDDKLLRLIRTLGGIEISRT